MSTMTTGTKGNRLKIALMAAALAAGTFMARPPATLAAPSSNCHKVCDNLGGEDYCAGAWWTNWGCIKFTFGCFNYDSCIGVIGLGGGGFGSF
jgi:hypothetical protein